MSLTAEEQIERLTEDGRRRARDIIERAWESGWTGVEGYHHCLWFCGRVYLVHPYWLGGRYGIRFVEITEEKT